MSEAPVPPTDRQVSMKELLAIARERAAHFAENPHDNLVPLPGVNAVRPVDPESWQALATAVDELVQVTLFQQALIQRLLSDGMVSDLDMRWSELVEQARKARRRE